MRCGGCCRRRPPDLMPRRPPNSPPLCAAAASSSSVPGELITPTEGDPVKHLARTAVLTALATGALVAASAPAMAAPATSAPEVAWVNTNVVVSADRSEATVLGKYRCSGGEEGTHLWVSVKQGPDIYPGHTSSRYADAW